MSINLFIDKIPLKLKLKTPFYQIISYKMNNVFKNQDIRGIILSKKKQMIDEEVLLELLLNESHFRHKIMLAELKERINEIMCYSFCDKYEDIDCPPAPIDEEELTLFVEISTGDYYNPKNAYYPYFDPNRFKLDYDGNLFQIIYVDR